MIALCVAEGRAVWGEQLKFYLEVYASNAAAIRAYEKAGMVPLVVQMAMTGAAEPVPPSAHPAVA